MGVSFSFEVFNLISSTTIIGVLYGATFVLYCLCAWSLYLKLRKPDKRFCTKFSFGYISFLFFCLTGLLALNSRMAQMAYINNADFPGGPLEYQRSYTSITKSYVTAGSTLNFIVEVLTMAVQVSH